MIVIALCAVLVVAIATLAIGIHRSRQHPGSHRETEHEGWTSAEEIRELGDAPPTPHPAAWEPVMAAPVTGQPPTWWDELAPQPVPVSDAFGRQYREHITELAEYAADSLMPPWPVKPRLTEGGQPCASGNGHVTVAEPLAPLPPEPKPGPRPASVPAQNATGLASSGSADAPAAATASRTGSTSRTAAPSPAVAAAASTRSPSDALTLLDERQQLIDHAAKVIAAAKFDRILGMAVSQP